MPPPKIEPMYSDLVSLTDAKKGANTPIDRIRLNEA